MNKQPCSKCQKSMPERGGYICTDARFTNGEPIPIQFAEMCGCDGFEPKDTSWSDLCRIAKDVTNPKHVVARAFLQAVK